MISQINFKPGDIVRVHQKIKEGDLSASFGSVQDKGSGQEKTRTQIFQGIVLQIKGTKGNKMFTVRKVVGDIAVERIFPVNSPNIEKVDVKGHIKEKVRRAKLYFLRKQF